MKASSVAMPLHQHLPKVTVVTIVLNLVNEIERTLKSVIAQDYPNLEYLVIDGCSTDGTLELIRQYQHSITTLVSEKDGGIYPAMNKGAAMATGEWILFMNGGDVFVANDVITRAFTSCNESACDVIYGDCIYNQDEAREMVRAADQVTLNNGNDFAHQSVFVRARLQKEYGFDISERIAADYDLFLRLFKDKKIFKRVDVVISEFFVGGFSHRPALEVIRLRHRVYTKHFPRSDFVLYSRIAVRLTKNFVRALVPAKVWLAMKSLGPQGKR